LIELDDAKMSDTGILSDYLDRASLARELNCAERTIARYEAEPDGLPSVMIAGKRYYRREAVLEFIRRRERRPNPRRAA
jgi:hypothetical protein